MTAATATQTATFYIGLLGIGLGVALFIWGIRWDEKPWWRRGWRIRLPFGSSGTLYVGNIVVSDTELDSVHRLNVTFRAHNGTALKRRVVGVKGSIRMDFSLKGTGQGGFDLASPIMEAGDAWVAAGGEFQVSFQQFLEPAQVQKYREFQAAGAIPALMFGSLNILVASRWGKPRRLPLWDGVSLCGGLVGGRIISVSMQATAGGRASMG